jgi:ribosome-binding factor A
MPKEYPRKLRINAQLQRELTELIRDELRDPRVTGTTVMAVDVAPDLRNANVRVSRLPPGADVQAAAAALNHAAGRLRHELKHRLRLRHVPELRFVADLTVANADHVNRLIRKARDEDREHAHERGESET